MVIYLISESEHRVSSDAMALVDYEELNVSSTVQMNFECGWELCHSWAPSTWVWAERITPYMAEAQTICHLRWCAWHPAYMTVRVGFQTARKRFAQIEQAHNEDTPIKFPTVLHFWYIVKIRSEGVLTIAPIDIYLETLNEFYSFFQIISPG